MKAITREHLNELKESTSGVVSNSVRLHQLLEDTDYFNNQFNLQSIGSNLTIATVELIFCKDRVCDAYPELEE